MRHAPGAEQDVRREPVDAGEADERPAERGLADEDDRNGRANVERRERGPCLAVEEGPRLVRAGRDAEPRRAHGTVGGGQPVDRLRDAAVLRDGRPHEDSGQHSGRGGNPERRAERSAVAAPETTEGEPDDVRRAPH